MKDSNVDSVLPYAVIGNDSRVKITDSRLYPYSAIAKLKIAWPDGTKTVGTAFRVNENQFLTAGHCVMNNNRGGYANNITITPGQYGSKAPYGTTYASYMYAAGTSGAADWGVLTIGGKIGVTGYFGVTYTTDSILNKYVYITGYPGDLASGLYQYYHSGKIKKDSKGLLEYTIDTAGGQSGAPVYDYNNQVWGIHRSGVSRGEDENGNKIYYVNRAEKISEQLFVLIGGKVSGSGTFVLITDPGFTDGN